MSLQWRSTSWLRNAHPVVVIDYLKCVLANAAFNGPLLPLNLEERNSHDGKQKPFLTSSLFLGLSRGFHFSSGWNGAPFANPLTANTVYSPRSSTFHMLEMNCICNKDNEPHSLSPPEMSLITKKAWKPSRVLKIIYPWQGKSAYIHVLSTLDVFLGLMLFPDTEFSFWKGLVWHLAHNIYICY